MAIVNKFFQLIEKFIIDLPDMDDEKFEKICNRIAKLSTAARPLIEGLAEGAARGAAKEFKNG